MMRSEALWLESIPELKDRYTRLNSVQNTYISQNNLPAGVFSSIVKRLQ